MATITWAASGNGAWTTAANWAGGALPGSADLALIQTGQASDYTVTLGAAATPGNLLLNDAHATLFLNSSGRITTSGTLTLAAGTLRLDSFGTLKSATIALAGGTARLQGGFLDGVTWRGTLALGTGDSVNVANGISLTGAGGTGRGAVALSGGANFSGNGAIANADFVASAGTVGLAGNGGTLALAASDSITIADGAELDTAGNVATAAAIAVNGSLHVGGTRFANAGSITIAAGRIASFAVGALDNSGWIGTTGGTISLRGNAFTGTGGTIALQGGRLTLIQATTSLAALGTLAGSGGRLTVDTSTLDLGGGTLSLGVGTAFSTAEFLSSTLKNGTVATHGPLAQNHSVVLDGVTWNGVLDLGGNAHAELRNGLAMHGANGSGQGILKLHGFNASLSVNASQTLANASLRMGAAGANFNVINGVSTTETLTLAPSTTLVGIGDAGSTNLINNIGRLANQGTIANMGGTLTVQAALYDAGDILAAGGVLKIAGAFTGTGRLHVMNGGTAWITTGTAAGETIHFDDSAGVLRLDTPAAFAGSIAGFRYGDRIDFGPHTVVVHGSRPDADHHLSLTVDGTPMTLTVLGNYAGAVFGTGTIDGHATVFTDAAIPCFTAGTRIATPDGEVLVERLRVGDLVRTAGGAGARITWIGHRRCEAADIAANPQLRPVRIRAGAIAASLPSRTLRLSPLHAVLVDDVLVVAGALVNGITITRDAPEAVDYFHIALAAHDLLLAEGMAAESFLDAYSSALFSNVGDRPAVLPQQACRPRHEGGPEAERARRHAAIRAGLYPRAGAGAMRGHVERIADGAVQGWITDDGAGPMELELLAAPYRPQRFWANRYRIDLDRAGIAEGVCGFHHTLPPGAARVLVRRVADGAVLPGQEVARAA